MLYAHICVYFYMYFLKSTRPSIWYMFYASSFPCISWVGDLPISSSSACQSRCFRWYEHAGQLGWQLRSISKWSWRHVLCLGGAMDGFVEYGGTIEMIQCHEVSLPRWFHGRTGSKWYIQINMDSCHFGSMDRLYVSLAFPNQAILSSAIPSWSRMMCCMMAWRSCWRVTLRPTLVAVAHHLLHPHHPHQRHQRHQLLHQHLRLLLPRQRPHHLLRPRHRRHPENVRELELCHEWSWKWWFGGWKMFTKQVMLHNKAVTLHFMVVCSILITAQLV